LREAITLLARGELVIMLWTDMDDIWTSSKSSVKWPGGTRDIVSAYKRDRRIKIFFTFSRVKIPQEVLGTA
jgi:hypothetical protein